MNGVLTSHAAQFWFPDSRDCSCCQGFKHGCKCCSGRVQVCAVCSQKSSSESLPPPAETNESDLPPTAPSTVRIPSNSNKSPNAEIPVKETSKNVTKSLVVQAPSKTLVVQAPSKTLVVEAPSPNSRGAQSWFPECRDCSCCQGFKHGCRCCQGSSRVCSCVATKPTADTKTAGECSYFKSGNCKYGDSCKFRHT